MKKILLLFNFLFFTSHSNAQLVFDTSATTLDSVQIFVETDIIDIGTPSTFILPNNASSLVLSGTVRQYCIGSSYFPTLIMRNTHNVRILGTPSAYRAVLEDGKIFLSAPLYIRDTA